MKAITAAALLRASRARFEAWLVLQIGPQEVVALEFAFEQTKNAALKEIQANGCIGINRISEAMFAALREGYKALEKLPPETQFHIGDGGDKTTTSTESNSPEVPDWLKEMLGKDIDVTPNFDDNEDDKDKP